jgi:SOS-response transcriptional repressor LexA
MQEKHKLVYEFIRAYIRLHGVSPSYAVIAKGLGMKSKANIHRIVHRLEEDGLLAVKTTRWNGIRVVDKSVREVAAL